MSRRIKCAGILSTVRPRSSAGVAALKATVFGGLFFRIVSLLNLMILRNSSYLAAATRVHIRHDFVDTEDKNRSYAESDQR